jgi:hypothetical protein
VKCDQKDCENIADSYVIWVDGSRVNGCSGHSHGLQKIAAVLGSAVPIYPIITEPAHE